jgi:prepilin-type N-terminal cleavage/methylation domain-containing protein
VKNNGAPPLAAPRFFSPVACRGWSLLELSVVLIVIGILLYFAVRSFQPKDALALQQAERLRNDVRRVQMLALTWNRPLRLVAGGGSYQVCCLDSAMTACLTAPQPAPCSPPDPITDPGNGRPFLVTLESGLALAGPGAPLNFDGFGRPKDGATLIPGTVTFTISGGSVDRTVVVAPITGFVTAQ